MTKQWPNKGKRDFIVFDFLSIQGEQWAIQEGPERIPELKKYEKMGFWKIGSDPPKSHHILGIQSSIWKKRFFMNETSKKAIKNIEKMKLIIKVGVVGCPYCF